MRDFDRLERELQHLTDANLDNSDIRVLNKLYARAIMEVQLSAN